MAKALVNRGVPIKADNPKDPYIRDEDGIKDIANSSTVFGKTLGTANGKIQLKNGDTVLSEKDIFSLYTESGQPTVNPMWFSIDPSDYPYYTQLYGQSLVEGTYYKPMVVNSSLPAYDTITVEDMDDSSVVLCIDCTNIQDDVEAGSYLYLYVSSVSGTTYNCVGYTELPSTRTDYEKPIKAGDYLAIENDTLKVTLPKPKYLTKNKVMTAKPVDASAPFGDYEYQLDTIANVYTGWSIGMNADINWVVNQDDIVQEAINYTIGYEGQKPVVISINPSYSSSSSVGDVHKHITMYPVYTYTDSNLDKTVVVFSSTVYDGTNVYLYSVKMYKGGPAAQIEYKTIV